MIVSQHNNRPQDKLCLTGYRNGYPFLHHSTLMTPAAGDSMGLTQLVVRYLGVYVHVYVGVGGCKHVCVRMRVCT